MAAVNPAGMDGYDVDELDPALLARFVQVSVMPDRDEWLVWAEAHGVHPKVRDYVGTDPQIFSDSMRSNPRAWDYVSQFLLKNPGLDVDADVFAVAVQGLVGPERAVAFRRYLKGGAEPLTAQEVLSAYSAHQHCLRDWVEKGKVDLLSATLQNVEKSIQAETDYEHVQGDQAAWENLGHFLSDLPGDLRKEAEGFLSERDYDLPPMTITKRGRGKTR
jgi:hypothetical protein